MFMNIHTYAYMYIEYICKAWVETDIPGMVLLEQNSDYSLYVYTYLNTCICIYTYLKVNGWGLGLHKTTLNGPQPPVYGPHLGNLIPFPRM